MASRDLDFFLKAFFDGSAAMRGLRGFARKATRVVGGMTKSAGLGAGFAGIGGKFRPGGAGGMLAGLVQGATGLAMAPVRILAGFAKLIPGIGGILGGVVSTGANILQGLVGIAANVVGGIVNALGRMVAAAARIFTQVVGAAGRILGKIVKIAGVVGLAAGGALAFMVYKGIKRNFQEAQLKEIFKARMGGAWEAAWAEVLKVRKFGGFEVEELADSMIRLQRGGFKQPQRFLETMVDTAHGAKASLQEVADILLRMKAGGGGGRVATMLQRLGFSKADTDRIKTAGDLLATLEKRYGGISRSIDRLDPASNIWRNMTDGLRDLTEDLANRLTPRLNRLVDWMDRFRGSQTFKEWQKVIGDVGEAITDRVEGAIKGVWNYLNSTNWAEAWAGVLALPQRMLDDVIPDIGKLFVDKSGDGWMGPITKAAVAGFTALAAQVRLVFQKLWGNIADDLRAALAKAIGGIGHSIMQHARKGEDEAIENVAKRMARLGEWKGKYKPTWDELSEEKREHYRTRVGVHPSAEILMAQAKAGVVRGKGEDLYGLAKAVAGTGKTAAQEERELSDARKEAAQSLKDFTTALAEAQEQVTQVMGGAGQVLGEAVPRAKPAEQIAAEREERRRAGVRETPGYKSRAAQIAKKRKTAGFARAAGYIEAAERLVAEADQLRLHLDAYLDRAEDAFERLDDAQKRQGDTLRRHGNKLKNIGTSRAR